ncbi:MAG: tetratricopeptide repeat protein [Gammaproteobacteria bacterium]|nr:MAG: tetratricopeptide repeat protein [Gammaproteobacteria bacterium]
MEGYETEDEQVEAIKKWWTEYSKSILIGLVIGAALVTGWRYYENYQHNQAATASVLFNQMLSDLQKGLEDTAQGFGIRLKEEFQRTPYAALAAMALARQAVDKEDYARAESNLVWAMEHAGQVPMVNVARLRLARVKLAQEQASEAMKLIKGVESQGFEASYATLEGDIYVAMKDVENARNAYQKALAMPDLNSTNRALVQMKLDSL